jgi:hypothetical protein
MSNEESSQHTRRDEKCVTHEDADMIGIQVGDIVRRRHPWDGTMRAGVPAGPALKVLKVYPCDTFSICQLSDGRNEFEFNLNKQSTVDFESAHNSRRAAC